MKEPFRQGISERSGPPERLTAAASVPGDSPWYAGHFPGDPILPGIAVLALVAEAITAAERDEGRRVVFTSLSRVRFRLPVRPGDRMEIRITRQERRGGWGYPFTVTLAEEPVCTGVFTAGPEAGAAEQIP